MAVERHVGPGREVENPSSGADGSATGKRRAAFSVRSSSQRWSRRLLKLLSSAAAAGLWPSERVCHNSALRSLVSSISLWIWVRVMSLKTSLGVGSFPRADEENDDRGRADDSGHDHDPVEDSDHQA